MIRMRSRSTKRPSFTLIELLVVIAIIAVLVSLTSAAVVHVLNKIPEVQTRTEISEMDAGLGAFMADFNLSDPPPSVLVLNESNPLASPSAPFLIKMFGKNLGATDWNGNGKIDPGTTTLQGQQCLVFYLGGIGNRGFSYNNLSPTPIAGQRTRGPYFTFQTSRLVAAGGFFMYQDAWTTSKGANVYAYFSSNGINNGYSLTDCASISALPYRDPTGNFTYSNRYQIISAGQDHLFGTGIWNPAGGAAGADGDNQANFSSTLLKAGQH